jgi:hypothetical protein
VSQPSPKKNGFYRHLVERIQGVVHNTIPTDGCVLVVSKGDEQLLRFDSRRAWHFPQEANGLYAGHNPANSWEAVGQLEALKSKGGEYLLFPQTAFWWLDYYSELRSHLDARYRKIWSDPDCVIYRLSERTGFVQRLRSWISRRSSDLTITTSRSGE